MGIILVENIIQSILKTQFVDQVVSEDLIDEVFESDVYTEASICDIKAYFGKHKIHVFPQYPFEDVKAPALYVASGDTSFQENLIDAVKSTAGVDKTTGKDVKTLFDGEVYRKSARVIATANNANIAVSLAAIAQYALISNRLTFMQYRLHNMELNYSEFDLISKFLPQTHLYRNLMVTFQVIDYYKRETANVIAGIDIDIQTEDFEQGIPV